MGETATLPNGWRLVTIEDAMSAIIDYRGKTPDKTNHGVPLITAKVVKAGRIMEPDEFIAESEYDAWMRRGMVHAGDVVVTTEAPLGEVAQLDDRKVALAQRLIALRGKPDVLDNTFLRFSMQSAFVQDQLRARASGTTVLGIRQSELRLVALPLPPLPTQRAIAGVLGALDDKIEVNRRMARTLEAAARALFESWFVRFEHPATKAPAPRLVDSPMGPNSKVPDGWQVMTPWEAFEVNPTRTLPRDSDAAYLDMSNMPTQGHAPESWVRRAVGSGMKFMNGDTLVARITPCLENGKTAFVDFLEDGEVGWGSTEYIVMRPKKPLPLVFAYCLARSDEFRTFAIRQMSGSSGRQRVPAESLRQFFLAVPPAPIAEEFGRVVEPIFGRIKTAMEQNRTLSAMRDALLPKLISGELPVPESLGRAD